MRRARFLWLLPGAMLLAALGSCTVDTPSGPGAPGEMQFAVQAGDFQPNQYIVLFYDDVADPGAAARALARTHGLSVAHVYTTAVKGFAATVPAGRVGALSSDARVAVIEADRWWSVAPQTLPTGIDRIEVDRNPTVTTDGSAVAVDYDVGIIDTGILATHEDLNVAGGRNFAGGPAGNWGDNNGHGTHVSGTVAAKDNSVGVVGVAPGARLWSVKVCRSLCLTSAIIAGIDWMAQRKADFKAGVTGGINFAAANFSISSADSDNECDNPANTTQAAICGLVEEGVVFVMAAGNDNREKTPYPVTFSVSAIADFDGKAGGAGSPTCRSDEDDTLANFSNFGAKVDIAAPGVCILSSWNDGGYNTISGTSMATPHVTGSVLLYLHANNLPPATDRAGADAIKDAITAAALPQGTTNHPCSYDDSRIGGPLLFANAGAFQGDGSCDLAS